MFKSYAEQKLPKMRGSKILGQKKDDLVRAFVLISILSTGTQYKCTLVPVLSTSVLE